LIVTKIWKLGQVQNWLICIHTNLLVLSWIAIVGTWLSLGIVKIRIEYFYDTLSNKVHFLNITLVADDWLIRSLDSAIHIDNQFICKTPFTFIKEVVECLLEFSKYSRAFYQISLHLGSHLVIKLKFLYN